MRELKFRAWDKFNKKMIQPKDGDFIAWHAMSNWKDCLIVMQFTGLTDKNGKEIFESDIITCEIYEREEYNEYESDTPIVVSFGNGGFYPFTKAGQWRSSIENIEVIGNIHENPDLIK